MHPEAEYVIDRAAVEAEVARTRATLAKGKGRYFARHFVAAAIVLYAIGFLTRLGRFSQLDELPTWRLMMMSGFPALGAAIVAWWSARETFKPENLDTDLKIQQIARDLKSLGGPGWIGRSLLTGVLLGAVIGAVVGLGMLLTWDATSMGNPNRWKFVGAFVGVTLLWTIPAAFILRWIVLVALKRMVRPKATAG